MLRLHGGGPPHLHQYPRELLGGVNAGSEKFFSQWSDLARLGVQHRRDYIWRPRDGLLRPQDCHSLPTGEVLISNLSVP